jgi:4-amino-4-deoxy-L-arabinose transferase-like glycosyltransferase
MKVCSRLHLSDYGNQLRRYSDEVGAFLVLAILIYEVAALYSGIGYYDDFYDEGVYLQSARMMLRGYHLYWTIFDSQPPLVLPLIYCSFRLFGVNFFVAQSVIAAISLMTTLIVALATRQLTGWGGAGLAAGAVVFTPMALWLSRTVTPIIPAIALSTAAMALAIRYVHHGSQISLCLAAILVTCSILTKLLGLFTLPALILMVGARHWITAGISPFQKVKLLLKDASFVFGIATILTVGLVLKFGPADVWRQAVEFHWSARSAFKADSIAHRLTAVASASMADGLLGGLTLLAVLSIFAGPEGIALAGWILFTVIGLVVHHPLYKHHLAILIPPIAIAGGVGWNHLPRLGERLRSRWDGAVTAHITRAFVVLVDVVMILLLLATFGEDIAAAIAWPHPQLFPSDIAAAQMIRRLTKPNETILTDAQGIAFLADRDVPPELTDTSFLRIDTGYLTLRDVIAYSDRRNVRLVLLWTGRLASIPGMTQWVTKRFPYHRTLGTNHDLYTSSPVS